MKTTSLLAYVGVTVTCGGLAFWAGCGSDDTAATPTDGDGGASSSSGGSSSGATSSSGTASSSGGSSSGGTNDGGSTSSGGNPDGGIDPPDAGPGGDTTKLTCGATTCALPGQQCCIADLAGPGNRSYGCASTAGDAGCPRPDGGGGIDITSLKCSGAANCPANTKCCLREANGGAASECKADCNGNEAQLCDPNATTDGCPQQDPCSNDNIGDWGLPNSYATCGGQGT